MDVKTYYQRIRAMEATITTPFAVVSSLGAAAPGSQDDRGRVRGNGTGRPGGGIPASAGSGV
jgi:hypothetical protein